HHRCLGQGLVRCEGRRSIDFQARGRQVSACGARANGGLAEARCRQIDGARVVIVPLLALALYAAAGFAVAGAFLVLGGTGVRPEPAPVTFGARIMLFSGTAALWPYVLIRWLKSSR